MAQDSASKQSQSKEREPLWEFYEKSEEEFKKILETPHETLSYVRGSPRDREISRQLEEYLAQEFITTQQLNQKKQVLSELEDIIQEWSDNICLTERKYVEKLIPQYRARLLPFGSYSLGVSSSEGDIDLVVVAPRFIDRKTHFNQQLLEMMQNNPKVTKCKYVDAKNPIITFYYDDQAIDISLGVLDKEYVPDNIHEEFPDDYLRNLELNDIAALNGRRNNMDCLNCVGHQKETYRSALKALKIWYKSWGMSPNRLGYFGGIDVAILVGKICQLFPNLPLNRILEEFFRIFSQWDWENVPVKIKPYNSEVATEKLRNYDMHTQKHKPLMTICTPSFPCINSIKATYFTQRVIDDLLNQTNDLIQNEINEKKKDWFALFEPYRFFDIYSKYIEIDILGNQDRELFEKWKDTCEVKMLQLYQNFEKNGQFYFHPFPKPCDKKEINSKFEFQAAYFIGVKKQKNQIMEGQRVPTKNAKLSIKHTIREYFIRGIQQELQRKQAENDQYQEFSVRVFQTKLKELMDIDFGKIEPQELKENQAYQQRKIQIQQQQKLEYNKDGFDENYNMAEQMTMNAPQRQLMDIRNKNKRKGVDLEQPGVKKLVKQSSDFQKPASQQDYEAADDFL